MLPPNVEFIGRSRLDAALYAQPRRNRRGRPRIKGERLPSPGARAKSHRGWRRLRATIYGEKVTVEVKVFDALWYVVAGGRLMRFVLIRGWPGHDDDDVLVTTDLTATPQQVIECYCLRWKLEVTFEDAKGKRLRGPTESDRPRGRTDSPDGPVRLLADGDLVCDRRAPVARRTGQQLPVVQENGANFRATCWRRSAGKRGGREFLIQRIRTAGFKNLWRLCSMSLPLGYRNPRRLRGGAGRAAYAAGRASRVNMAHRRASSSITSLTAGAGTSPSKLAASSAAAASAASPRAQRNRAARSAPVRLCRLRHAEVRGQ
jgi:hypothetical protein